MSERITCKDADRMILDEDVINSLIYLPMMVKEMDWYSWNDEFEYSFHVEDEEPTFDVNNYDNIVVQLDSVFDWVMPDDEESLDVTTTNQFHKKRKPSKKMLEEEI